MVAASVSPKRSSSSAARVRAARAREPRQAAEHHEVLGAGEHVVDGGGLAGEADPLLDALGIADDVDAGDDGGAGVGAGEGREHVDGRRLAGAVGAEEREDLAAGDLEVETVEDDLASERLSQAPDVDGGGCHRMASLRSVYGRNCL